MPLYFAYGSNLDVAAMAARCPGSRAIGPACLKRHRFIVTRDGYASVVRDPRREVHGLLFDLALSDLKALDRYESLSTGLYTKILQPVVAAKGAPRALVYVGRTAEIGAPKPGYMEGVLAAAEAAGLPAEYRRELEGWSPGGARPSATGQAVARPVAVRPRFAAPASVRMVRKP